jgi:hypothetical protein
VHARNRNAKLTRQKERIHDLSLLALAEHTDELEPLKHVEAGLKPMKVDKNKLLAQA